ncbi:MAG: SDR family oxidoreductase [Pseudomonadota bacterium]
MHVLVLGAYGLIGHEICRHLLDNGFQVTGLARSEATGRALLPDAHWIGADLSLLAEPDDWSRHLSGIDAVVNAAGALQSGAKDNVTAVQETAMKALYAACEAQGIKTFIQISAPGVSEDDAIEFIATKARADDALGETDLQWVILRPGVVVSHQAYGGTALLRMLAGFPLLLPLVMAGSKMQTVHVRDVAHAVKRALTDETLFRKTFDLVEDDAHNLEAVVLSFRRWLGFPQPYKVISLPSWFGYIVARGADLSGHLGWRSPLRTTALKVLECDVVGDPEPWRAVEGQSLRSLDETLKSLPVSGQERLFARMQLLFPILVIAMAIFWFASGIIGLVSHQAAIALVSGVVGSAVAGLLLVGGAVLDILIAAGLLVRRTFRLAVAGSLGLSIAYLISGTVLTPDIWLDPLGPFVKILPVFCTSLVLLAMSGER